MITKLEIKSYSRTVKSFSELAPGVIVASCMNGDGIDREWYVGKIVNMSGSRSSGYVVDIDRTDGHTGGGVGGTWRTIISPSNLKHVKLKETDWDE